MKSITIRNSYLKYHKYMARPTEVDGIRFASKKESEHYQKLKLAQKSGEIVFFLRQVPFHLPGGVKYICDFLEFWKDGSVIVRDVKGYKTAEYKAKKKIVEALYPVKIEN